MEPTAQMDRIIDAVCTYYGQNREAILRPGRPAPVAWARQVAMFLARERVGVSFSKIGRHFNRTHRAVIHAVQTVQGACDVYPKHAASLDVVRSIIDVDPMSTKS